MLVQLSSTWVQHLGWVQDLVGAARWRPGGGGSSPLASSGSWIAAMPSLDDLPLAPGILAQRFCLQHCSCECLPRLPPQPCIPSRRTLLAETGASAAAAGPSVRGCRYDAFRSQKRTEQSSIHYEKAAVAFNIGALQSQLGLQADRRTEEGLIQSAKAFQVSTQQ